MMSHYFSLQAGPSRRGHLMTSHGVVATPVFMPVGTLGTVKAVMPRDLKTLGVSMILANTYHLYLRPGTEEIRALGGLHHFMGWDRPILTDSGGFQVYSLAKLRKVADDGVTFQSHVDGSEHFLTPERVMDLQQDLGSDVWMPLDECLPDGAERSSVERAVARTTAWAKRSQIRFRQLVEGAGQPRPLLFGIVQGGMDAALRRRSAEALAALDLDGYAIGGLCVGEPVEQTFDVLAELLPFLPKEKPRYFMGLGTPDELVRAVQLGVDLFDSVVPTRLARHGSVLTLEGTVHLKNKRFVGDANPIDKDCTCYTCQHFSRAYLRHLLMASELLAMTLLSLHNIAYLVSRMRALRKEDAKQKEVLVP